MRKKKPNAELVAGQSRYLAIAMLDISGALITIDAMGYQKRIARTVIEAEADYLLALKDNHPQRYEDVKLWLDTEIAHGRLPVHETLDKITGALKFAVIV